MVNSEIVRTLKLISFLKKRILYSDKLIKTASIITLLTINVKRKFHKSYSKTV